MYILGPLEYQLGISKTVMASLVTPVVLIGVWLMLQRLKKHLE
jgi:uncharacterized membrane-anchored protein